MRNPYAERPTCQGCGKEIAYGQSFMHRSCTRQSTEMTETDLQISNLYEIYEQDPDITDCPLLGIYTSFGSADAAATNRGTSGTKAYIRTVKGVVYNGKAYILKHMIVTPVDIILSDIDKQKKKEALDKLTPEERSLLGLDSPED